MADVIRVPLAPGVTLEIEPLVAHMAARIGAPRPADEEWLSPRQFAARLGVGRHVVDALVREPGFPVAVAGPKSRRVPYHQALDWLRDHRPGFSAPGIQGSGPVGRTPDQKGGATHAPRHAPLPGGHDRERTN